MLQPQYHPVPVLRCALLQRPISLPQPPLLRLATPQVVWYAENQELLSKNDGLVRDQQEVISQLEHRLALHEGEVPEAVVVLLAGSDGCDGRVCNHWIKVRVRVR